MKVAICLLTLNNFQWTKACIESIEKHTQKQLYDLYILDNGSSDGTVEYLKENKYKVLFMTSNVGIIVGRNLVTKFARRNGFYDYICQIHNDMLFTDNWLDIMLKTIQSDEKCLLLGIANIINRNPLDLSDDIRNSLAIACRDDKIGRANLDPRLIHNNAYDLIGFYDESFIEQDCEDCDFNKRVEDAGYKFLATNRAVIWHPWQTTRKSLPNASEYSKRNIETFKKKHGGVGVENWNSNRKYSKSIDGKLLFLTGV